jgi:hypothetical protein
MSMAGLREVYGTCYLWSGLSWALILRSATTVWRSGENALEIILTSYGM